MRIIHKRDENSEFISRTRIALMRKREHGYDLYSTVGHCVIASCADADDLRQWAHEQGMAVNDNLAQGRHFDTKWIQRDKNQPTFKMVDLGIGRYHST